MGIRDSTDLMSIAIAPDPILLLQIIVAVFIVLTLPGKDSEPLQPQQKPSEPEASFSATESFMWNTPA